METPQQLRRCRPPRPFRGGGGPEAGQTLVFLALAMPMLLGMVGLATDVGNLFFMKHLAQSAADAAAIAGATALRNGASISDSADAASAANKFTNGTGGVVVAANNGPLTGFHAGDTNYVEVIISAPEPTFFLNVLGLTSQNIAARAVAFLAAPAATPGCVYLLGPSGSDLSATGNATISSGCGIYLDSNSSSALSATGNVTIDAPLGIVGNESLTGNTTVTPAAVTGMVPFGDPLSYLTPPTVATCNNTALNITGNNTTTVTPARAAITYP